MRITARDFDPILQLCTDFRLIDAFQFVHAVGLHPPDFVAPSDRHQLTLRLLFGYMPLARSDEYTP